MKTPPPRILALEPDSDRGERLKQLVRERVNAEVVVARSGDAAVAAISLQVPDVILTSTLLPPQDEARLLSHLKRLTGGSDPPVLMVPPVGDLGKFPKTSGSRRSLFARRRAAPWPPYDPDAIGARIKEALEQSQSVRSRSIRATPNDAASDVNPVGARTCTGAPSAATVLPASGPLVRPPGKHPRAHRWVPSDLPWVCSVKTPWGLEARVLNLSKSGMLIESQSKLAPDSFTEFKLCGQGSSLIVRARIVRSEVAAVDVRGVKYQAAAVFDGKIDLIPDGLILDGPQQRTNLSATPHALAELLIRVTTELGRGGKAEGIRSVFEEGLRRLVSALEIKIRDVPAAPIDGNESIVFRVPDSSDCRAILQVIFEPNHKPTGEEFMLLRAAASVAAVVLQYERRRSMLLPASDETEAAPDATGSAERLRLIVSRNPRQLQNRW